MLGNGGNNGSGYNPNHVDMELTHYDRWSVSSYGSHANRDFNEFGSHKGSLHSYHASDFESAMPVLNNNGNHHQQIMDNNDYERPLKTVIINDNHIDARSITYEEDMEDDEAGENG